MENQSRKFLSNRVFLLVIALLLIIATVLVVFLLTGGSNEKSNQYTDTSGLHKSSNQFIIDGITSAMSEKKDNPLKSFVVIAIGSQSVVYAQRFEADSFDFTSNQSSKHFRLTHSYQAKVFCNDKCDVWLDDTLAKNYLDFEIVGLIRSHISQSQQQMLISNS